MKILVIGSANADMVIKTDAMPLLGQTVVGKDFTVYAGGKGLNQAVAISKLGGNVSFLGAVGSDPNGKMLTDTLKEYGVSFAGKEVKDTASGTAIITLVGADNFIVLDEGANATVTPEFITENESIIKEADFVVMQLEIPIESVLKVCEIARKSGTKIVLNPAPYKQLPTALYGMVDYIIPNEHEAKEITGIACDTKENVKRALENLLELGAKNVIITLGEKGSAYALDGDIYFQSAYPCTAVDTTSAGDSFIGALVVKLCEGVSLNKAIDFATKVSSITVSRHGAARSIPYINEVI